MYLNNNNIITSSVQYSTYNLLYTAVNTELSTPKPAIR